MFLFLWKMNKKICIYMKFEMASSFVYGVFDESVGGKAKRWQFFF